MATTRDTPEKDTENKQLNKCDQDWCDGPEGDTLPCFDCFELDGSREEHENAGDDTVDVEPTIEASQVPAAPEQLLTGMATGRVLCVDCATEQAVGEAVTVYAARGVERTWWRLHRYYCTDCTPATIVEPTLGVTEILAQAWLGMLTSPVTRSEQLCLTDVAVTTVSPPGKGAHP